MKDYTYLLRFSDSVITDCQGQNLCGAISATVVTNKGKKGEKCKKTKQTNKKTVIDHVAAILTNIKFYCKKKNDGQAEILIFYHRQMEIPVNRTLQSRNFQGQEEDSCPVCENHVCKNHGHPCT